MAFLLSMAKNEKKGSPLFFSLAPKKKKQPISSGAPPGAGRRCRSSQDGAAGKGEKGVNRAGEFERRKDCKKFPSHFFLTLSPSFFLTKKLFPQLKRLADVAPLTDHPHLKRVRSARYRPEEEAKEEKEEKEQGRGGKASTTEVLLCPLPATAAASEHEHEKDDENEEDKILSLVRELGLPAPRVHHVPRHAPADA